MPEKVVVGDVLIVGSGLAGLRAAMQTTAHGLTTIVATLGNGASPNVFGFAAYVEGNGDDSFETFWGDLMRSGGEINDPEIVATLINRSGAIIPSLAEVGYYVTNPKKSMRKGNGAGHTRPRGFSSDVAVGPSMLKTYRELLEKRDAIFLENTEILYPVMDGYRIVGAVGYCRTTKEQIVIRADAVVLACGGVGSLIYGSSYPQDVKAGYAPFALLAGAEIADMEFAQTEPATCMSHPAVMNMPVPCGFFSQGAVLLNANGERFIKNYGYESEGGLGKAILVRCIATEINEGRGTPEGGVYYDARAVDEARFKRFESKNARLAKAGLSFKDSVLMVRPGPHSHMGGVVIDKHCQTSVSGLFAAGESASGVHGAARMAGCGGTTALVFGDIAGTTASEYILWLKKNKATECKWEKALEESSNRVKKLADGFSGTEEDFQKISMLLRNAVGMERDAETLKNALDTLENMEMAGTSSEVDKIRLYGTVITAKVILTAALMREESRGCHYRSDFPEPDEKWMARISFYLDSGDCLSNHLIPCKPCEPNPELGLQ